MVFGDYPRIVRTEYGQGTATGSGDVVVDDRGQRYRIVDAAEAQMIRNSTGGMVYRLYPDGTVR